MNVYKRLVEARKKFHSLKLTKTGENKFAGYKYFELGDFLVPALGVFAEVGLCSVVSFDKETASMTIQNVDGDDCIVITSPMGSAALKGCHEVQNIGAVETYQRRYLWVAALEIVEHDALDATTGKETKKTGVMADVMANSPELPKDQQEHLTELASIIKEAIEREGASQAFACFEADQLDNDQKLFLWSKMDSKTRAAIKAESKRKKESE